MYETRIKMKNKSYCVQRRVKFICFFKKWKTIALFSNYYDALLCKIMYIPKEIFENNNAKGETK